MLSSLKHHWLEYLIEAWGLGTFMVSAGSFATLLFYPESPLYPLIPNEFRSHLFTHPGVSDRVLT